VWERCVKLVVRHKWKIGIAALVLVWLLIHFHVFR
jgi:hypothetical protein